MRPDDIPEYEGSHVVALGTVGDIKYHIRKWSYVSDMLNPYDVYVFVGGQWKILDYARKNLHQSLAILNHVEGILVAKECIRNANQWLRRYREC